jgi:hypothetical protein
VNGQIYDIAIDDVFADGYDQAGVGWRRCQFVCRWKAAAAWINGPSS